MTEQVERHFEETISALENLNNKANIRIARLLDNPEPSIEVCAEIETLTTRIQGLVAQIDRVYTTRNFFRENAYRNATQEQEEPSEEEGRTQTSTTAADDTNRPGHTGELPPTANNGEPSVPTRNDANVIRSGRGRQHIIFNESGGDDVIIYTSGDNQTAPSATESD